MKRELVFNPRLKPVNLMVYIIDNMHTKYPIDVLVKGYDL